MTDLALFHVKTVRDGDADFTDHENHSFVRHDSKTFYYDFTGRGVTANQWRAFVTGAWELISDEDKFECGVYDAERGTFYADID